MKRLLLIAAAMGIFAAKPVFAADSETNANSTGGKPSTSMDTGTSPAAKNEKATESAGGNGASMGSSGASKELPGASDSAKTDSSLSTNGNKPKQ